MLIHGKMKWKISLLSASSAFLRGGWFHVKPYPV